MLAVEDLCDFMASRQEAFDLVVAANSLTYSGALEPVFKAAATTLKPRGWLAFDIESQAGADYRVMPTGRFRHAEDYVRSAAKGLFRVADSTAATLRREAGKPVEGFIFLMRKI
jgi:predicted TPR repeat methyltransferase